VAKFILFCSLYLGRASSCALFAQSAEREGAWSSNRLSVTVFCNQIPSRNYKKYCWVITKKYRNILRFIPACQLLLNGTLHDTQFNLKMANGAKYLYTTYLDQVDIYKLICGNFRYSKFLTNWSV